MVPSRGHTTFVVAARALCILDNLRDHNTHLCRAVGQGFGTCHDTRNRYTGLGLETPPRLVASVARHYTAQQVNAFRLLTHMASPGTHSLGRPCFFKETLLCNEF